MASLHPGLVDQALKIVAAEAKRKALNEGMSIDEVYGCDLDLFHDFSVMDGRHYIYWTLRDPYSETCRMPYGNQDIPQPFRRAKKYVVDDIHAVAELHRDGIRRHIDTEGAVRMVMSDIVNDLDLRAELFWFRLYKYFPQTIGTVKCEAEKVIVSFKNGQVLECKETELTDTEFLAKCALVHDV